MNAKYTVDVTAEEVKVSDKEKKELATKSHLASGTRKVGTGKESEFSVHKTVNAEVVNVPEGSFVVTFADGLQKVISAEEAKGRLQISKTESAESDEVDLGKPIQEGNQILETENEEPTVTTDQPKKKRGN